MWATLGGEAGDDPEVIILGRKVTWVDGLATYEADDPFVIMRGRKNA